MAGDERPSDPLICHRCGRILTPGEGNFWMVKIDAVRDPSPPQLDSSESLTSIAADYEALLAQMSDLSERELMDQVHRRMLMHLCHRCFGRWTDLQSDESEET